MDVITAQELQACADQVAVDFRKVSKEVIASCCLEYVFLYVIVNLRSMLFSFRKCAAKRLIPWLASAP